MAKIVESNPDRFMYQPNVSPIKHQGVKNTIQELVYWVKEKGAKIFKFYPPEDTYINDPEIWPFYEKAQELGIVLDIHTGFCWVPPGKSKYALPVQLDDVARDFPELKINAFHMGYPYCDDLNMIAMQSPQCHCLPEPAVSLGSDRPAQIRQRSSVRPCDGSDRIKSPGDRTMRDLPQGSGGRSWGSGISRFPRICRMQYGYPPITDEDRAKIFGGNLARLLGIDTTKTAHKCGLIKNTVVRSALFVRRKSFHVSWRPAQVGPEGLL